MSFLNKFQYHYHSKQLDALFNSKNYFELLSYLEKLSNEKKTFHDLSFKYVNHAIHSLTDDVSNKKIIWINSFLGEDKKYILSFLENYLSNFNHAYVYIINHPYEVYKFIKRNNNNDQEIARNIFLNLDHKASLQEHNNTSFYISKKGWHTNTQSWTDANVINSLKGKIISKKELYNSTYDVLSSIILHLIQSGVEMDLNYDLIDNFIKKSPLIHDNSNDEISSKERKFLDKYVQDIIESYDPL